MRVVVLLVRSRTKMSPAWDSWLSSAERLVAVDWKATTRPSAEIEGWNAASSAGAPAAPGGPLTSVVVPAGTSRRKTSVLSMAASRPWKAARRRPTARSRCCLRGTGCPRARRPGWRTRWSPWPCPGRRRSRHSGPPPRGWRPPRRTPRRAVGGDRGEARLAVRSRSGDPRRPRDQVEVVVGRPGRERQQAGGGEREGRRGGVTDLSFSAHRAASVCGVGPAGKAPAAPVHLGLASPCPRLGSAGASCPRS